ncbi:MAG: hypothetical protein KGO53_05870 [Alphaproteobacteria bacterium]|nr:hypothetical protein [Alphaproteobacteria bacterium]
MRDYAMHEAAMRDAGRLWGSLLRWNANRKLRRALRQFITASSSSLHERAQAALVLCQPSGSNLAWALEHQGLELSVTGAGELRPAVRRATGRVTPRGLLPV